VIRADPAPRRVPPWPGRSIRVVPIPFRDAYVDAVLPSDVVRVGPAGVPSPWLDSRHLVAHADDVDVVHLHTPFDHLGERELECWTETLRRLGVPLVMTVHEVPPAGGAAHARLATVLATAEVVLTLTPGAADEVAERFGRTAIVVACPWLTAPDPEAGAERGLVGLRLPAATAARPDASELVRAALSGAVSGGGRLRVLADAPDDDGFPTGIAELAERGDVELVRCRPGGLAAQLQQLHVAVLPEEGGRHSRELEMCRDVGTGVVAPRRGWFAEQWSEVVTYVTDETGAPDAVSVAAAVAAALTRPMPRPADRSWRLAQAAAVTRVHADVYAQVAADRGWA
jgi:hypothetical protein